MPQNEPIQWQPPQWSDRDKHWTRRGWDWEEVVAQTGAKRAPARYIPELLPSEIEALEMGCMADETNEFLSNKRHVRYFFLDAGKIIGASAGKEVRHIFVEYHMDGTVHGRPITAQELRQKGAPV